MAYSIREAADAAGVSKSTIQRRLKSGDLSRDGDGKIEPSELARVYPDSVTVSRDYSQNTVNGTARDTRGTPDEHSENGALQAKLEAAQQTITDRDRELAHRDRTIDDLRDRLDKEGEERRRLTAMLTDQRTTPVTAPEKPAERSSVHWGYLAALAAVAVAVGALWLAQTGALPLG